MNRLKILKIVYVIALLMLVIGGVFFLLKIEKEEADNKKAEIEKENQPFKEIGIYRSKFGTIRVLTFGEDTIYVADGSHPISIEVK